MTMYDYVWQCMSIYDYVWLCMTMHDNAWLYSYVLLFLTMYEYVCLYMTIYYYIWLFLFIYIYKMKPFFFWCWGTNIFTQGERQSFYVGGSCNYEYVIKEVDMNKASKLSVEARPWNSNTLYLTPIFYYLCICLWLTLHLS